MVLWGNVALGGPHVNTGLVHPTVTIAHLVGRSTGRQGKELDIPYHDVMSRKIPHNASGLQLPSVASIPVSTPTLPHLIPKADPKNRLRFGKC